MYDKIKTKQFFLKELYITKVELENELLSGKLEMKINVGV